MEKRGSVYIMASGRNGTLYTGVTSDLVKRAYQHRTDAIAGFTSRYDCKILVWFEVHDRIDTAILREKRIKEWRRGWKLGLIEAENPEWEDLFPALI